MPTINLEKPNTKASNQKSGISQVAPVPTTFYVKSDVTVLPDEDLVIALQDTAGATETYCDVQLTTGEFVDFFEEKTHADTHPHQLFTQIIELLTQLDPIDQGNFMEELSKLEEEFLTKKAIAEQNAKWAARLDRQLARIARGENRVYYSEEEVFAALENPPSKDRE